MCILKAFDTFCQIALPKMFYKCILRPAGLMSPHLPTHTPTSEFISLFPHLLPIILVLKKSSLLFSFAFPWLLVMLSTCHIFISHLWFCLLSSSFVCFPNKAPIFSLMVYKSSKVPAFLKWGPAALAPSLVAMQMCQWQDQSPWPQMPGSPEVGRMLPWRCYPSGAWRPSHFLSSFPGHRAASQGRGFTNYTKGGRMRPTPWDNPGEVCCLHSGAWDVPGRATHHQGVKSSEYFISQYWDARWG